jgi:DNA polymerase III epsilon subunit family exonuclease
MNVKLPENYTVIDIETTGLSGHTCQIIEIAAIRYRNHEEAGRYTSFVYAEYIPGFITGLTGIRQEMVDGAPVESVALDELIDFIGDDILIGHNIIRFDAPFIEARYRMLIDRSFSLKNRTIDTLALARRILPGLHNHKLETVASALGVTNDCAHRAFSDVEATHQCYRHFCGGAQNKER